MLTHRIPLNDSSPSLSVRVSNARFNLLRMHISVFPEEELKKQLSGISCGAHLRECCVMDQLNENDFQRQKRRKEGEECCILVFSVRGWDAWKRNKWHLLCWGGEKEREEKSQMEKWVEPTSIILHRHRSHEDDHLLVEQEIRAGWTLYFDEGERCLLSTSSSRRSAHLSDNSPSHPFEGGGDYPVDWLSWGEN